MNVDDGMESRNDVQPFSPAENEHAEGSSDVDDENKTQGDYTKP